MRALAVSLMLTLMTVPVGAGAGSDVRRNPHEIVDVPPDEVCQACHKAVPPPYSGTTRHSGDIDADDLQVDGVSMCQACHDDQEMHMVGVKIDFSVPRDLPLDDEQRVMCLTCHYAHGRLTSDRPWAAVSFMDRLMNHDDLHKSYLLRRNNSGGELCLVCHDTEREGKP